MQDTKDIDRTIRICQNCGGSKLVAYDPNCTHVWPKIMLVKRTAYEYCQRLEPVLVWCAWVEHRGAHLACTHPVAYEAVQELRKAVDLLDAEHAQRDTERARQIREVAAQSREHEVFSMPRDARKLVQALTGVPYEFLELRTAAAIEDAKQKLRVDDYDDDYDDDVDIKYA
jgi:hypothetical protein